MALNINCTSSIANWMIAGCVFTEKWPPLKLSLQLIPLPPRLLLQLLTCSSGPPLPAPPHSPSSLHHKICWPVTLVRCCAVARGRLGCMGRGEQGTNKSMAYSVEARPVPHVCPSPAAAGNFVRFSETGAAQSERRWCDGSLEEDLPMRGLSQMFNVK